MIFLAQFLCIKLFRMENMRRAITCERIFRLIWCTKCNYVFIFASNRLMFAPILNQCQPDNFLISRLLFICSCLVGLDWHLLAAENELGIWFNRRNYAIAVSSGQFSECLNASNCWILVVSIVKRQANISINVRNCLSIELTAHGCTTCSTLTNCRCREKYSKKPMRLWLWYESRMSTGKAYFIQFSRKLRRNYDM